MLKSNKIKNIVTTVADNAFEGHYGIFWDLCRALRAEGWLDADATRYNAAVGMLLGKCPWAVDVGDKCDLHRKERGKIWVNVYHIHRCYGGPEEGGWWYNALQCVASYKASPSTLYAVWAEVQAEHGDDGHGDIYSANGGMDVAIYGEKKKAQSETRERPYYC